MAYKGKTQLTFVIIAPPDQVAEGDRLFASHEPWMKSTHPRAGDAGLLEYNVTKSPELSNPMDPASASTGNMVFVLTEVYETGAGVAGHFEMAAQSWKDFPALMEWLGKCKVSGTPLAPIINSLW
jgi:hypothetical protein